MNSKPSNSNINAELQRAVNLQQSGKIDEANALYKSLLKIQPKNIILLINLAISEFQKGNLQDGIRFIDSALKIDPNQPFALHNRGRALHQMSRLQEALVSYEKATLIKPDYAEAHNNLGLVLQALNRPGEAIVSYNRAIRIEPHYIEAYNNRGVSLQSTQKFDAALESFNFAIQLNSNLAEIHYNRGNLLKEMGNPKEAINSFNTAIKINPTYAEALNNRGAAQLKLDHAIAALSDFDLSIRLQSEYAEAHLNKALALRKMDKIDLAIESFNRALELNPNLEVTFGTLLSMKLSRAHWDDFDVLIDKFKNQVLEQKKYWTPFSTLVLIDDPEIHLKTAEHMAEEILSGCPKKSSNEAPPQGEKIRIGYYSSDFYDHATMHLMAELFESHDKSKFEVTAFSFGPQIKDQWHKRAEAAFDHFIDVSAKTDDEIVDISRSQGIDIAVDLKGHTSDARTEIFFRKIAPIQINYLGYPGTMGSEVYDYIVADATLIPESKQRFYKEKIIYLPHSYQANMRYRDISDGGITKQTAELPEAGFIFCCFNKNTKILPETFACWMRILAAVNGGVLWLLGCPETAQNNMRREALKFGIAADRLIFASMLPIKEHLRRIQLADLFLDTLPYNAHTTASDTLRMGVPVLTLIGESFAGRVAASLLKAVGLPELIVEARQDYQDLAIRIATDRQLLQSIKNKLHENLSSGPLFDSVSFTRYMESAYSEAQQRHRAGLPLDHIHVVP